MLEIAYKLSSLTEEWVWIITFKYLEEIYHYSWALGHWGTCTCICFPFVMCLKKVQLDGFLIKLIWKRTILKNYGEKFLWKMTNLKNCADKFWWKFFCGKFWWKNVNGKFWWEIFDGNYCRFFFTKDDAFSSLVILFLCRQFLLASNPSSDQP